MRNFMIGILLLLGSVAADAITLNFDSKNGDCQTDSRTVAVIVTCDTGTNPNVSSATVLIENAVVNGNPIKRFTFENSGGQEVFTRKTATGMEILIGAVPVVIPKLLEPNNAQPSVTATKIADALRPAVSNNANNSAASANNPLDPAKDKKANDESDAKAKKLAQDLANDYQLDFSIPDAPAFTLLGMTPGDVVHPRTSRALLASIKNGLDQNGKLKAGLAIEFAPFRLVDPENVLKSQLPGEKPYEWNTPSQALMNTSISLATAQGTASDDKSLRMGLGVHIPVFDKSDGRNDPVLKKCYASVQDSWLESDEPSTESGLKKVATDAKKCFNTHSAKWNASAWTISFGQAWTSDSGSFGDRKTATRGLWTNYAYGFDGIAMFKDSAQLIFQLKAMDKERVPDPKASGKFLNQNSRVAGLAFKFGNEDFNASIQSSYQRLKMDGLKDEDKVRKFSLGIEYKLAPNVWLVGTIGGEGGRTNGENKSFVLGSFKFAPSSKPLFSPDN